VRALIPKVFSIECLPIVKALKCNRFATITALLLCSIPALALDPSVDVSQYAHSSWKIRDGFSKDYFSSIVQTPDGYLWFGSGTGLIRFDGVRNVPWTPVNDQLHSKDILSLLATLDGRLWIGTTGGLASWKDGKLTQYPELTDQPIYALLADRDGTVWAGGGDSSGRLCEVNGGKLKCYGEDGSLGHWVNSLYEDKAGNLWVGCMGLKGLWRWKPGPPKFYPMADPQYITDLNQSEDGSLLIAGMSGGIQKIVDGKVGQYELPGVDTVIKPRHMLRDRGGALWIGTAGQGLFHLSNGRVDSFTQADGLSGDFIQALFEDREGNIWVATMRGLDRFREFAIPTISLKQGLSNSMVLSVVAANDGSMWFATPDGLNRWSNGQMTIYRHPQKTPGEAAHKQASQPLQNNAHEIDDSGMPDSGVGSLFQDSSGRLWVATSHELAIFENGRFTPIHGMPGRFVSAMAEDNSGGIWLSELNRGLIHIEGTKVVETFPWDKLGHKDDAPALVGDPVRGGIWLGFSEGGVAYFKDGKIVASYGAADGLGNGTVSNLQIDPSGVLWATWDGGLTRIKDGHVATLTSKNGLPCDAVEMMSQDNAHDYWLYLACGLVRISNAEMNAWIDGRSHTVKFTSFDSSDGVRIHANTSAYSPGIAKSADGKIWFLPFDGVSVIDPLHLPFNKLPPPVHVEQITADRKTYSATSPVHLPPLPRDLEIDYTALSFVAPEKVLFRYKLDGADQEWHDVGDRRQAFYTSLPPGNYHFRVTASNNDGVWNQIGATQDFSIAPAFYQTAWFRILCFATFIALLWAIYYIRVRAIERRFRERQQAAEALRRVQSELEHVSRVSTLGELTASLAHEINQPIAAAVLDANTCNRWLSRDEPDLQEAREAASRTVKDATHAAEIITRVRTLFKKGAAERVALDVNELIEEMVVLVHDEARAQSITVRTELAENLPHVSADRVQIQQVMMNLMMNSIDAMKGTDGVRELLVRSARDENDGVLVTVSDTGLGIPADKLDQIFQAFFTTKSHGTGLGLRISRSIVESHSGRLWAANHPKRGAILSFTLPVKADE
jgi:signal transduction histidine kinase/ligand-binding sensor domain-containing protein